MNVVDFQQWAAKGGLRAYNQFAWDVPIRYVLWLDPTGRLRILPNQPGALGLDNDARADHSLATFDDPTAALAAYRLMNETGARE